LNNNLITTVAHAHEDSEIIPYLPSPVKVTHKINRKITDVGSEIERGITITVPLQHAETS